MLKLLFPNYKDFKFFTFSEVESLDKLFSRPFIFKILKRSPSHLAIFLIPFNSNKPLYFLKAYQPRLFKRNRVKAFKNNFQKLQNKKIPVLIPHILFYENPLFSYLNNRGFYGGILYPYFEKGFLKKDSFFKENSKILLKKLVKFIFDLHEKGILLGDTKYNNFYYDESYGFKIFDLDGLKILKKRPEIKKRLKDLSSLAMTLEWIGYKEASLITFEIYSSLIEPLSLEDKDFYKKCIEIKRRKRMKKLGLL